MYATKTATPNKKNIKKDRLISFLMKFSEMFKIRMQIGTWIRYNENEILPKKVKIGFFEKLIE